MKSKQILKFKDTEIGKIPVDWDVKKILDVDSSKNCVQTGPFGSLLHSYDYQDEGYPLILVKHVKEGKIIEEDLPKIGEKKYSELSKFLLKEGDIVFTRVGYVGNTAYVEDKHTGWLFSGQTLRIRISNPEINNKFISFFFQTENFKNTISNMVLGSTRDSINTQILRNVLVPVPPKNEQNKIVSIINSFIKKIQSLENKNKILEQIAQTIFKSWFVDFDGVTEFVDSELGKIPKGWKVTLLKEIAKISSGIRPEEKSDVKTSEYKIPCYGASKIDGYVKESLFKTPVLLTGRVGTLRTIHRVNIPCFSSDNTLVITAEDMIFYEYIFFCLHRIDFQSYNRGTSQPLITQTDLKNMKIIIPSNNKIEKFHKISEKMFKTIENNQQEINQLDDLLSLVLPKLISGEIIT